MFKKKSKKKYDLIKIIRYRIFKNDEKKISLERENTIKIQNNKIR
jgi:hypothetical protein